MNFFSFKIGETYTLTTSVDQKQSLSVLSKSIYDSLIWLAFLELSKLLKKILDCRSFSISKILTGFRPYSHNLYHFPRKFPSVPKRKSHKRYQSYDPEIYVSYSSIIEHNCPPKLFKLALDSWHGYQATLMLCFHCRCSNLSCSTDHSQTNFLKLGRWNKQS